MVHGVFVQPEHHQKEPETRWVHRAALYRSHPGGLNEDVPRQNKSVLTACHWVGVPSWSRHTPAQGRLAIAALSKGEELVTAIF